MNADQIISLTAVVGGTLIGLVSILSGRSDRALTRELAVRARQADRLHEGYIGMLELAEKMGNWLAQIHPIVDTSPPQPAPSIVDVDLQISAFARIDAYGSDEVRELADAWRAQVQRAWLAAQYVAFGKAEEQENRDRGGARGLDRDYREQWSALQTELKPAEEVARKGLTEQIRVELRSSVSP